MTKSPKSLSSLLFLLFLGCSSTSRTGDSTALSWQNHSGGENPTPTQFAPDVSPGPNRAPASVIEDATVGVDEADDKEEDAPAGSAPKKISAEHAAKLRLRSSVRSYHSKLFSRVINKSLIPEPSGSAKRSRLTPTDRAAKRERRKMMAGELEKSSKVVKPKDLSTKAMSSWYFDSYYYYLEGSSDPYYNEYTNNMNLYVGRFSAPYYADRIRLSVNWIDTESFDRIKIYDYYGLCDEIYGYGSYIVSDTCYGNYLDVYFVTDSSVDGSSYDGFEIDGIEWAEYTIVEPVAIGTASSYTPKEGQTVNFNGSSSYDPDGYSSDLDYDWDFGDGTSSTSSNPSKVYNGVGSYRVELTVTDRDGASDTDSFWVVVSRGPPDAYFTANNYVFSLANPFSIYLAQYPRADRLTIDWGDGVVSVKNPFNGQGTHTHSYTTPGIYVVTVTAENATGVDVDSRTIDVRGTAIPPTMSITNLAALNKLNGTKYNLEMIVWGQDDGSVKTLTFNWGGANPATAVETFSNPGYSTKRAHAYNKIVNNKAINWAGVHPITVVGTDNEAASTTLNYIWTTPNLAPKAGKKLGVKCVKATRLCTARVGPLAKPLSSLLKDTDGEIALSEYAFYMLDKTTPVAGCAVSTGREGTCTISTPGTYFARFRVVDNLGKGTLVWKKFKVAR